MTDPVNRRAFLGSASAGIVAALASSTTAAASASAQSHADIRLAGHSLRELRDLYRHDLFDDYLPFVDRHVFDHERAR